MERLKMQEGAVGVIKTFSSVLTGALTSVIGTCVGEIGARKVLSLKGWSEKQYSESWMNTVLGITMLCGMAIGVFESRKFQTARPMISRTIYSSTMISLFVGAINAVGIKGCAAVGVVFIAWHKLSY
ncbi:MAG: hypothetical protein HZB76_04190 [Chlamydiae bacterium]|nr:hypothetical protein [Chlamydiota bacterium]